MTPFPSQKTIRQSVAFADIGIHSGQSVSIVLHPAPIDSGILFRRSDLPDSPTMVASLDYVVSTARSTNLAVGNATIHTVEHLLAAVYALEISNLVVEVNGAEIPVGDGSSLPFLKILQEAGIEEQNALQKEYILDQPIYWSSGETHLVALPHSDPTIKGLKVSYTLCYPGHPLLDSQYYTFNCSSEGFISQIAPCRTFSLYEEVQILLEKGLIKGGSLNNAVVIQGTTCLNPEGLRFSNEMVRHKILDLIGDMSLLGYRLSMHIIAIRSGHPSHNALAKKLLHHITAT